MLVFTQLKVLKTIQIDARAIVSIAECSLSDFDWICLDIFPSHTPPTRQEPPTSARDLAFCGAAH